MEPFGVISDMDGTLVESERAPFALEAWDEALQRIQPGSQDSLSMDDLSCEVGISAMVTARRLLSRHGRVPIDEDVTQMAQLKRQVILCYPHRLNHPEYMHAWIEFICVSTYPTLSLFSLFFA